MSGTDKARNKVQKVSGIVKAAVGRATGNRRLQREGRIDQRSADVKDAGEKIKDVFRPRGARARRRTPR
ncbi:MAG: CsbD family protein [Mycobacterium sp.]